MVLSMYTACFVPRSPPRPPLFSHMICPPKPLPFPDAGQEKKAVQIRSVWSSNIDYEFHLIRRLVDLYPYVSMDTEFPGVVYPQDFRRRTDPQNHYMNLKSNVDKLKLIQVGITLTDGNGNLPDLGSPDISYIWEFNFSDFDVARDDHSPCSIELLRQQGINFEETRKSGVNSFRFAELMMSSGLVCNDNVTYITFHSAYDFGYLIKSLTGQALPDSLEKFLELLSLFFGSRVYDVKHLMKFSKTLHGGLDRVAGNLSLTRVAGKCHQAGSDSLLTWQAFEKIRAVYFNGDLGLQEKYAGVLYGLEVLSAA